MKKYNFYDVIILDKYGNEHFYTMYSMQELLELLREVNDRGQEVKLIKGRVR